MKKIIALIALAAAFAGTVNTPSAFANAGCGTHQVQVWGFLETQGTNDQVNGSFDFQCGGTTSDYRIVFHLEVAVPGGWVNESCDFIACTVYRPTSSSFYAGGTEHGTLNTPNGPDWTWHPSDNIENNWYRIKAVVHFANGDPDLTYYSAEHQG